MSHFLTLVFSKQNGDDIDELLAPYDENLECEPYVKHTKEQAVAMVRKQHEEYKNGRYALYLENPEKYETEHSDNHLHINYLKYEFPKVLNWTDEECYNYVKTMFNDDFIGPNGELLSDYNPNAKWDYYQIGGRWNKYLKTINGEFVNTAYVSEVNLEEYDMFAFISPDGEWHERGEMGWFCCVNNEMTVDVWKAEIAAFVKTLDANVVVTVVDCHI